MPVKKKLKTSTAAHEGLLVTKRCVISMTSSNRKRDEAARSEPMAPTMSRVANSIDDNIAQCRGIVMPQMSKSVLRRS